MARAIHGEMLLIALAIDHARASDRGVFDAVRIDHSPGKGLGVDVPPDHRPFLQMKFDAAFEENRTGEKNPGWHDDRASARGRALVDGLLEGSGGKGRSSRSGAEIQDISIFRLGTTAS